MITAPYNFVPLNKEVFYPSWSEQVRHDIPFTDGESGEIDITITAKSPIYIRNHYQSGDEFYTQKDGTKVSMEFCYQLNQNGAKEFYIPGSSFKGMVRSVLEIMSFSKMRIDEDKFQKSLSVRDMTPKQYCLDPNIRKMRDCPQDKRANLFPTDMAATAQNCGFLKIQPDGSGILLDCGKTISIHHDELKKFGIHGTHNLETAKQKYDKLEHDNQSRELKIKIETIDKRQMARFTEANKVGQLVLSGNITGKKNEFVFIKNGKTVPLKKEVVDNFKKVYFQNESGEDGQYWHEKYKHNKEIEIPIFYIGNNQIQAIGLTQIFKLAYTKTILDAAKQSTDQNKLDLAETIFGIEKEKLALKGRVQFSHLKSTTVRYEKQVSTILGSPNPTYYPNYIKQDGHNGKVSKYKTLMDADAVISGWKRYPLHSAVMTSSQSSDKEAVKTYFKPLPSETVFEGKLRFHNLKKAEIGALLSAITFHAQSDKCMHNLGMAKPLGYGKIDIKLNLLNLRHSEQEYLQEFEKEMAKAIKDWRNSQQLNELFAMANINTKSNEQLSYQLLEKKTGKKKRDGTDETTNEFTDSKKRREYLIPHSQNIPKEISNKSKNQHQPLKKETYTITEASRTQSNTTQSQISIPSGLKIVSKNTNIEKSVMQTIETWQERVQRELANPARSFKGILNDLKMNAQCYRGHVKEIAIFLKQEFMKAGRWQEMEPTVNQRQDDYIITLKIKEFL